MRAARGTRGQPSALAAASRGDSQVTSPCSAASRWGDTLGYSPTRPYQSRSSVPLPLLLLLLAVAVAVEAMAKEEAEEAGDEVEEAAAAGSRLRVTAWARTTAAE